MSVLIAYPHPATAVQHCFMASLAELRQYDRDNHGLLSPIGALMVRCNTGGLPDARNSGVRFFLDETDAEWLLWIDTDMGFRPDSVKRLVDTANAHHLLALGGLCFSVRQGDPDGYGGYLTTPRPTLYRWDGGDEGGFTLLDDYPIDSLVQVDATGAAFLMLHRSALYQVRDMFGDEWFSTTFYPDGRHVAEDLSFCRRLMQAGVPLYVHTGIRTTHAKTVWIGERDYLAHRAWEALNAAGE